VTDEELSLKQLEAPSGSFSLKTDGQGRLTIPIDWVIYFEGTLGERDFFITLDKGWLKIFPKRIWMKQKAMAFAQKTEEEYEDWSITMQHFGTLTSFDKDKRLTPSQTLRTELNLKGAELMMTEHQGTLRGKLKGDYEVRVVSARESAERQVSRPDGARLL
jgi:DNA-binding transcriptional regulator/RsmH inhibitor MraZ